MSSHTEHPTQDTASVVTDPVCGMDVDPSTSEHRFEYDGRTHHFCSGRCLAEFAAGPETYLVPHASHDHARHDTPPRTTSSAPVGDAEEWTCPMHPEVRQAGPGSCPICGMALEPVTITAAR